jgi:hypothetical protein
MSFLGDDALQEVVELNSRPGVGGGRTPWPAGHVARPAGQHLASYQLNQVDNCYWDSYKYPTTDGIHTHHTLLVVLNLERFQFSSRRVGEALSGVESRVQSSLDLRK